MNPTRWAFLFNGITRLESQEMEIQRATLARALGLPLMLLRDKDGKLRAPAKFEEMQPLLFAVAQPHYAGHLTKQWEEYDEQQKAGEVHFADIEELDTVPVEDTDTGIEILDKPLDRVSMTEAERRQVVEALGIQAVKPAWEEPPKESTGITRKTGSFSLDD